MKKTEFLKKANPTIRGEMYLTDIDEAVLFKIIDEILETGRLMVNGEYINTGEVK